MSFPNLCSERKSYDSRHLHLHLLLTHTYTTHLNMRIPCTSHALTHHHCPEKKEKKMIAISRQSKSLDLCHNDGNLSVHACQCLYILIIYKVKKKSLLGWRLLQVVLLYQVLHHLHCGLYQSFNTVLCTCKWNHETQFVTECLAAL